MLALSMGAYLKYLNKRQAERRVQMGLPRDLKDMSIMTSEGAEKYRAELATRMREEGMDERKLYENSFNDLTDFEWVQVRVFGWWADDRNPTFIYVL